MRRSWESRERVRFGGRTAALGAALLLALSAQVGAAPPRERNRAAELERRLEHAELLAGLTPVEGPGLVVFLRDSARPAPRGADPESLRIGEQDVNAVLTALRAAGAEALAVGDERGTLERVVAGTAVRLVGGALWVHDRALAPPYRILAIGDTAALRAELYRPRGVVERAALEMLGMIRVEEAARLELPAARPPAALRFVRPVAAPSSERGRDAAADERPSRPLPRAEPRQGNAEPAGRPRPAAPPEAPPARSEESAEGAVFAARGFERYHYPGCRFGERIDRVDRLRFRSAAEAERAGHRPCPVCAPSRELRRR